MTGNTVDTWYPQVSVVYFDHTGFGPNSDPKKERPVAGTYWKQNWQYPIGDYQFTERSASSGVLVSGTKSVGYQGHRHTTNLWSYSPSYDNQVYNEALSKLWDSIKQTESNLALTLGEWRETGRMLKVGQSVFQVLGSLRKAKRDFLRNPSKSLSSYWLSYQYGWRPAMLDIHNYLNWAYHTFDGMTFRSRRRKTVPINDIRSTGFGGNTKSWCTGVRSWQAEFGVNCSVTDSSWFTLSRVTSMNPLSIAWELTPLSFVFDWFYDVGSFLENLENALGVGLQFNWGYYTEVNRDNLVDHWFGERTWTESGFAYSQSINDISKVQNTIKRRVVLTGFPLPRLPTLKLNLGSQRILSATALTRTIVLGKAR